jgi:hypothetical protein
MDMAEAEQPDRLARRTTIGDIRQLTAGSTPHFALQLRARIARLIAPLPHDDPVRAYGRQQCALLEQVALRGEFRGEPPRPDLPALPSLVLPSASASPLRRGGAAAADGVVGRERISRGSR